MILLSNSKLTQVTEYPVAAGATITAEGQALVADYTGGVFGVKPSAGASGEQFAGVSLAQQLTLLYMPMVERFTLPATGALSFTTSFTPASGTIRVHNVTDGADVAAGAAAGNYGIVGNVVTIVAAGASSAGEVIEISYRFSPTTIQARALQGDIPAGGAAALTLGTIGVVTQGTIITSEFDTSVDWSTNPTVVKLGANGLFTVGGSGITVPNAYITEVPNVSSPYLGIHFSV